MYSVGMESTKLKKSRKSSGKSKHKKSKKHKRQKDVRSSSGNSDSDNVEVEWVEVPPPSKVEAATEKRDAWMQEETYVPTLSREEMTSGLTSREKKRRAEANRREEEEEVKRSRELNPHWNKGGTGLPEEVAEVSDDVRRLPSSSVGDGGYGYLRKAHLRIREQAQREGRSMEEVAVERWGSLAKLELMIKEAEARMQSNSRGRYSRGRNDMETRKSYEGNEPFQRPSSDRQRWSPERSFEFQKPKDYDRHQKKVCNVSSSSRRSHTSFEIRTSTPSEIKAHSHKSNEGISSAHSSGTTASSERRSPAWKKVKAQKKSNATLPVPKGECSPNLSENRKEVVSESGEGVVICTEDDLNRLAAKYLRADLSGDSAMALRLKLQLEEARATFKKSGPRRSVGGDSATKRQERVMLTKMDSSGQQRPVISSREDSGFERRSGHKLRQSSRYSEDDCKYSLKQMFEREKLTTTEDHLEMFLEISAQCENGLEDNETSSISKRACQKMGHTMQEEKDIGKAIQQHQKLSVALEKCEYCLDQPNMKRHLIITIFEQVYLCIPNFQSLTKGHCLIVPKRHVPSFLALDEDEWSGFQEALGLLRGLFARCQKTVLCLQTSFQFGRCPHAVAECIPMPLEDGDQAPLYFKKAILESEEEWAHNIKLVDLSKKGLRRSVPKNLPYFCVLFDPAVHAGYAHVIEDEKAFPRNFGKEVIGGMLDIDYNNLYKNRRDDPLKKSKEALEFTKLLEDFRADVS